MIKKENINFFQKYEKEIFWYIAGLVTAIGFYSITILIESLIWRTL